MDHDQNTLHPLTMQHRKRTSPGSLRIEDGEVKLGKEKSECGLAADAIINLAPD
ncbi:hypothetical protein PJE062_5316 [Pseudovibrio sp. JE062]|nr:hypothetical protein PJE062_5316 [Pseudovibrio sp. JE062]